MVDSYSSRLRPCGTSSFPLTYAFQQGPLGLASGPSSKANSARPVHSRLRLLLEGQQGPPCAHLASAAGHRGPAERVVVARAR